ncbi:MAG: YkvA family protein [Pseudomonadales bacterium]
MAKPPYRLARYLAKAVQLVRDPARALDLARQAAAKLDRAGDSVSQVQQELATMVAMLKAWARGDYPGVSRSALLSIVAGVLYFVSPLDAIPDFLLGIGLVDDVAVIGYIVKQLRSELAAFALWQSQQRATENVQQSPTLVDQRGDSDQDQHDQ